MFEALLAHSCGSFHCAILQQLPFEHKQEGATFARIDGLILTAWLPSPAVDVLEKRFVLSFFKKLTLSRSESRPNDLVGVFPYHEALIVTLVIQKVAGVTVCKLDVCITL